MISDNFISNGYNNVTLQSFRVTSGDDHGISPSRSVERVPTSKQFYELKQKPDNNDAWNANLRKQREEEEASSLSDGRIGLQDTSNSRQSNGNGGGDNKRNNHLNPDPATQLDSTTTPPRQCKNENR